MCVCVCLCVCERACVRACVYLLTYLEKKNLQQRNEMIAHLKDQLQEMKAKTSMEGKYIKKDAEVRILDYPCHAFYSTFIKYFSF